ncbi:testis-expressed protein 10 [Eurosta solidaginis]|uniref:testis-expressed protein 10 n=1 Tax=Eurosta solidaginis TaxID=178769 RepID=UPI003530F2B8
MVSHKKKLRSEKAKVKLKATKLPKGLNVTKTEFKVRKIAIREQLKETQYTSEGQPQLNLKETISRLKHHSSKIRADALRNLREAIGANSVSTIGYMNSLVQSVSAISLDVDRDTRRDSFKALKCLLGTLKTEEVVPFFHIISSYLRCAMTHINTAIQEDSLLMLDVLLENVPKLVVTHSTKIVRNFLEMISRVRKEGDHNSRTLTFRLGQKQTAIKWRTKVLERLNQILATLAENKYNNSPGKTAKSFGKIVTFNPNAPQHYSIKRQLISPLDDFDILCHMRPSLGIANDNRIEVNETERLREYVTHLVPLLVESWIEVRPKQQTTSLTLANEAAQTLKIVLEILQNLWHLIELQEQPENSKELSTWFKNEYANVFSNTFVTDGFPYQQICCINEELKKKSYKKQIKSFNSSGGQLCLEQNICVAYLMLKLYKNYISPQQEVDEIPKILEYLTEVISNLKAYSLKDYHLLIMALRACLVDNGIHFIEIHRNSMQTLLNGTIDAFLQNSFPNKVDAESEVLTLICDIVHSVELRQSYGNDTFQRFLEYLPHLLIKPIIHLSTLISMSILAKQKELIFLHSIENTIEDILENIQKILVVGAPNAFEGKKHILNLFYWTERNFSLEYNDSLHQSIDKNITDKRIANYAKYIFS